MDSVSTILGSTVDAIQPLTAAGLDSLGAVELRNSLEGELRITLPATLLFDYPTVHDLAAYLKVCEPHYLPAATSAAARNCFSSLPL